MSLILYEDQLESNVRTSLTRYRLDFMKIFDGLEDPMIVSEGYALNSYEPLLEKYPVPYSSIGFEQFAADWVYKDDDHLFLIPSYAEFIAAVKAKPDQLAASAWKAMGWADKPRQHAIEARIVVPEQAWATAVEANAAAVDGVAFFHGTHYYNPFQTGLGSFGNLITSSALSWDAAGEAVAIAVYEAIRNIKTVNGNARRGLRWTDVVVPPELQTKAEQLFQGLHGGQEIVDDSLTTTIVRKNKVLPYGIKVHVNPFLTSATSWYPIVRRVERQERMPWIVVRRLRRPVPAGEGLIAQPPFLKANDVMEWMVDGMESEGYRHGNARLPRGHVGMVVSTKVGVTLLDYSRLFKCTA